MTILNNTLTKQQIESIYVNLIGDFTGDASEYEMEKAVIELMNGENLTLEDCFHEMDLMGLDY